MLQTAFCPRCKRGPQPGWYLCSSCLAEERAEKARQEEARLNRRVRSCSCPEQFGIVMHRWNCDRR